MNKDFITLLREIRGSAAPGEPVTDGIWYELTVADKNGNDGIYGDILAKYGIVTESAGTFDQAVAILENLNVVVTTLPANAQATSALVNGVWQLGIPRGTAGIDGIDGFTPEVAINYSLGKLNYTVTVDGIQITNNVLVDLDQLVDTVVNTNVDVQTTLTAKQEVVDAVETAQAIAAGLDANVADKIVQLSNHTITKIEELNVASAAEKLEISEIADTEKLAYDQNAILRTTQYNENHTIKLDEYNTNDEIKIEQYNDNHITRLVELNDAYAGRITDMLRTQNLLGAVDQFSPQITTQQAQFLSTSMDAYAYYRNGIRLNTPTDYTVFNETTIDLVVPIVPGDVVIQIGVNLLTDLLISAGQLTQSQIGIPNGVAGLDENARIPAVQLPSYVDDVLEFANLTEFPVTGETSKIYVALDTNKAYRWSGSVYVYITSGAVDSVAGKTGVVTLVKSDVGLSNVDNTADATKEVASADKLTTTRTISIIGDVTGSVTFDGSDDVSITATVWDDTHSHGDSTITDVAWSKISSKPAPVVTVTLTGDVTGTANSTLTDLGNGTITVDTVIAANSVKLGTDTTGNYVAGNTAGTGIAVTGTAAEGWSPTISLATVGTAGTYPKVTTDTYGRVTSGTTLSATDIPVLDASKITTGTIDSARLPSYVDDVLEYASLASFPVTGETGKIYIAIDTGSTYRWSGSAYIEINTNVGSADTATKLATARTISLAGDVTGSTTFDGSANVSITATIAANSVALGTDTTGNYVAGLTAGTGITVTGTVGEGWSPTISHADTSSQVSVNNSNGVVLQDVTVDTYGHITAVGSTDLDTRYYTETEVQTSLPKVGFDMTNTITPSAGQMAWNQNEKTIDLGINGIVLQLGQELMMMVRNNTASTIVQGTACMSVGTIGASGRVTVAPADMSNAVNAFRVVGVATEDIAPGADGFVTYFGKVRTVNTSAWNEGDMLYLSNSTAGVLTNVVPVTGVKQTIARVINVSATVGTLMVRTLPFDENKYMLALNGITDFGLITDTVG